MSKLVLSILVGSVLMNIIGVVWILRKDVQSSVIVKNSPETLTNETKVKGLSTTNTMQVGDPMDIKQLPSKIGSWNLYAENWKEFFRNGEKYHELLYNDHEVGFVRLSPSHTMLGFYFHPEGSSGDVVMAVLDIDQKFVKEIYRGDTWTSNWEWKGDEAVIVKRSCGTGCMQAYVIDVYTGEKVDQYRVY